MKLKLGELFKGDNKVKFAIIIAGMLIILIAFSGSFKQNNKEQAITAQAQTLEQYKITLQTEIKQLLEQIDGVSEVNVMITLKGDAEYIYAKEEKQNIDKTATGYDDQAIQQRDNYENNTILVEDQNGRKTALVKTRLEPKVKGVLIVCNGAQNPLIEQKVTNAVKTVLSIGANNVCVVN